MNPFRLSIRLRLTLWNTAVVMLIVSFMLLIIFMFLRSRILSSVEEKAEAGYATVADVITNSGGDLYDVVHLGQSRLFLITTPDEPYLTVAWAGAHLPQTLDRNEYAPFGTFNSPDGNRYMLKVGRIPQYDYKLGYAVDATETYQYLSRILTIFEIVLPGILILSLIAGYAMAGRALLPVKALTKEARAITAESLSRRLPVANPHDEIGHLTIVFNDTLARLERSFEQLRRFTSDASHELRTPLTAIRSVGEVALQGSDDEQSSREAISSMLVETERLSRLVDNLLTLSRGDSGKLQVARQELDLSALVNEVIDQLRVIADESRLCLHFDTTAGVSVMGDSSTLRQALVNVLHNAIRYTPEGGNIAIALATPDAAVTIEVADSGGGIAPDQREKVFERFYRVDKARSRTDGGAGLGLSIARWAVEINGGRIEFIEPESTGARCRITLPRKS